MKSYELSTIEPVESDPPPTSPEDLPHVSLSLPVESERLTLRATIRAMTPVDLFLIVFSVGYMLLSIIASAWIPEWAFVAGWCVAVIGMVFAVGALAAQYDSPGLRMFHMFYVVPLVPAFFKLTEKMSYVLHGRDYDSVLIAADRLLFGHDPTLWLYDHFPHPPALTEYLQITYSLFYFLPLILAIELYRRRLATGEEYASGRIPLDDLERLRFIMVFGFCFSYLGYLLFPAIGPRFTVHDFFNLDRELPGLWLTTPLRSLLNAGENMRHGMSIFDVERVVTRDAFPSGHTDMTFVTMILAFHFRTKSRWVILVLGTSLIFATVYLRYHYVVDLFGGFVFGLITLYSWRAIEALLIRLKSKALLRLR